MQLQRSSKVNFTWISHYIMSNFALLVVNLLAGEQREGNTITRGFRRDNVRGCCRIYLPIRVSLLLHNSNKNKNKNNLSSAQARSSLLSLTFSITISRLHYLLYLHTGCALSSIFCTIGSFPLLGSLYYSLRCGAGCTRRLGITKPEVLRGLTCTHPLGRVGD